MSLALPLFLSRGWDHVRRRGSCVTFFGRVREVYGNWLDLHRGNQLALDCSQTVLNRPSEALGAESGEFESESPRCKQ